MAVGGSCIELGAPPGASAESSATLVVAKVAPAHGGIAQPPRGLALMLRGGDCAFILSDSSHFGIGPAEVSSSASMKPFQLPFCLGSSVTLSLSVQPLSPCARVEPHLVNVDA